MSLYSQLFLRETGSPYGDITRNSTLSFKDLDQNFIFLKERDINQLKIVGSNLIYETLGGTEYSVNIGGASSNNTFVTGFTFNNPSTYKLTIEQNQGETPLTVDLSSLASDVYVLSGSYNPTTGDVTYVNSTGGTFVVSGFTTGMTDTFVTGGTLTGTNLVLEKSNGVDTSTIDLSSLGGGGVSYGADMQIPFTNAGGSNFDYTPNFIFDDVTNPTLTITSNGTNPDVLKLEHSASTGNYYTRISNYGNIEGKHNLLSWDLLSQDNGMFLRTTSALNMYLRTNSTVDNLTLFTNGNASIGDYTDSTARLNIKGAGNDSSTSSFYIKDSNDIQIFEVKDDGTVVIPNIGSTTSVTNLGVDASGNVVSGSSVGSSYFQEGGASNNALLDTKGTHSITGTSGQSIIAGGNTNKIFNGTKNGIVGGQDLIMQNTTTKSFMGGGDDQTINNSDLSAMIGGYQNYMNGSANAIILAGQSNSIATSSDAATAGGVDLHMTSGDASFMGGGNTNTLTASEHSGVIGGQSHTMETTSNFSFMGAGRDNTMTSAQYGGILGGSGNTINGFARTFILGGLGVTATQSDTTYVPQLNIQTIGTGTSVTNLGVDIDGNVVSGLTSDNFYVTGGTLNDGTLTLERNDDDSFDITGFTDGCSSIVTNVGSGNSVLYSLPLSANTGAFFDYVVSGGTGVRSGSLTTVFSGSSAKIADLSTADIGDTSGVSFNVTLDSIEAKLNVSAVTGTWRIEFTPSKCDITSTTNGGEITTAINVGSGEGLFSGKSGVELQFKSLESTGGTVTITSTGDTINLESSGGSGLNYITSGDTVANNLELTSNWDINGVYTGATATGTQADCHVDSNYWFTCVDTNQWIRLIRG